jgi:tetratricopeptide (TPR) repeat protein
VKALLPALLAALVLLGCTETERRFDEAGDLRRAGKPRESLRAYQEVLAELGEGPLSPDPSALRLKTLKSAADVAYLELGDYMGAIAYYRRIISLSPGSEDAMAARAMIGDIYRDRFKDRVAAIAQYADVAASKSPQAPVYQLKVAREYLELKNYVQARTEARILRDRWPQSDLAEEAQLITAQAWALEKREREAVGAFQALVESKPRPDVRARALEGQAHVYAQQGKLDRAIELYTQSLADHPNPAAIQMNLAAVRRRREASRTAKPGDRAEVFDRQKRAPPTEPREQP